VICLRYVFNDETANIAMEEEELPFKPGRTQEIIGVVLARGPLEK
jgi:hypothetical protein